MCYDIKMKNKEQLLYFFLQGKISLSQYDYKFMANLQTMIQNQNRVTSNQATLFDNLISKYKKQLTKQGFVKEELKLLPWKTMVVESTPEFTGAVVSLIDDTIMIRVPFNKTFIHEFRNTKHNRFEWSKDTKTYSAPFSTTNLKIAFTVLPKFFNTVRYDDDLQPIINELQQYEGLIWNPTLKYVNGKLMVIAANSVLAELIKDIDLTLEPKTLFNLSKMGIDIDPSLYADNPKLEFAASYIYNSEFSDIETIVEWMKTVGCEHVMVGRALRTLYKHNEVESLIEKHGMTPVTSPSYGVTNTLGVTMLLQHTSNIDNRGYLLSGKISKVVIMRDSRPIEVI